MLHHFGGAAFQQHPGLADGIGAQLLKGSVGRHTHCIVIGGHIHQRRAIVGERVPAADLLVLANFLNEIELGRGGDEDEDVFTPLLDRWAAVCASPNSGPRPRTTPT